MRHNKQFLQPPPVRIRIVNNEEKLIIPEHDALSIDDVLTAW